MPVHINRTDKPHIGRPANGSRATLRPLAGKGQDGSNVLPTDTAIAAAAANPASATTVQLRADYARTASTARHALTGYFHTSGFGAVGDWNGSSGTDNLAAFNAAAAALLADGGKGVIYIDKPGDYRLSDGWMLDGDSVDVICHPGATVRTTTATSVLGCTVTFMGNGIIGGGGAANAVVTPQRARASWTGGRVIATGSSGADNAIGFVRYKESVVTDVTLDADRKALTAQYGVDSIRWERVKVTRGLTSSINIEGTCKRISLKDINIESTTGKPVEIICNTDPNTGSPFPDNEDVLLDNITVSSSNSHASSVYVNRSKRVTIRKCTGPGELTLSGFITDLTLAADNAFTNGVNYGSSITTKTAPAVALGTSASWTDLGAPHLASAARKGADGMVTITYARSNPSSANLVVGTVLGTVPAGYRPSARVTFAGTNAGATPPSAPYLYIEANGNIVSGAALGSIVGLMFAVTYPAA